MIKWIKMGKHTDAEGTTISYWGAKTHYVIESRLRHIPHACGTGTWDHTSYFAIKDGEEVKEFWRLSEAKAWVEETIKEG